MIILLIIVCIILALRDRRKTPAQRAQAFTDLAIYANPSIILKMEEHRKKMELMNAKIARENNTVVQGDQTIEINQLKIKLLERELGIYTEGDFNPKDYPS
jgi:hypothetical protein